MPGDLTRFEPYQDNGPGFFDRYLQTNGRDRRNQRRDRRSNMNTGSGNCDSGCEDGFTVAFTIISLSVLLLGTYAVLQRNRACLFEHADNPSLQILSGVFMAGLGAYCSHLASDVAFDNDDLSTVQQGSLGTLTFATVEAAFVLTWAFYWTKIHPELTCPCDLSLILNHVKLSHDLSHETKTTTEDTQTSTP